MIVDPLIHVHIKTFHCSTMHPIRLEMLKIQQLCNVGN